MFCGSINVLKMSLKVSNSRHVIQGHTQVIAETQIITITNFWVLIHNNNVNSNKLSMTYI